jgi:hypothetical protein
MAKSLDGSNLPTKPGLCELTLKWNARAPKALVEYFAPGISRPGMSLGLLVVVAPLTLFCSMLLYRFVENPGIQLGRRIGRSIRPQLPAEPVPSKVWPSPSAG